MATPNAVTPLDILESMVKDVLVQAGKALNANRKSGKKTVALSSPSRIFESNERFNAALDDMESDIIRAKAVLERDLDQLREKKRPVPEPVMVQQAPPAPMVIDLESPKAKARPSIQQGAANAFSGVHRPAKPENKPMAPFPNMGIDVPSVTSPQLEMKTKPESRSPQPAAKPGVQAVKAPVKAASTAMKVAFTATKARSSAIKTGSPATKAASPAVKPGSSAANVTPKAAPKATPPPPVPISAPAPAPVATPAAAPVVVPVAPIGPVAPAAPSAPDTSLTTFFDLTGTASGPAQVANRELNFTDIHFSLEPAPNEPQSQPQASEDDFDLAAYTADVAQNLLSGDTFPSGVVGQAEVAPMEIAIQTTETSSNAVKQQDKAPDANMDDMFNLAGTSIDMDLDLGGEGVDTTTNFDELYFDGGDTDMAEFDDSYFGI